MSNIVRIGDSGQAGASDERTKVVLEKMEALIAEWDQESGLTYRELAAALHQICLEAGEVENERL